MLIKNLVEKYYRKCDSCVWKDYKEGDIRICPDVKECVHYMKKQPDKPIVTPEIKAEHAQI
jgi:hypothetical protein